MDYIDQTILNKRLQIIGCCISNKINAVTKKLHIGIQCEEELLEIKFLTALIEIPLCYTPITDPDDDGVINTVTEAELDKVWDKLKNICKVCFPAKGDGGDQLPDALKIPLLDEAGDPLLDEALDKLLQELYPL